MQRYYAEHEKLKAKQEAEREDKTSEDTGSEKYSCLKNLIATAPGVGEAPSLPTTPVVTMGNPVVATAMETQPASVVAMEVPNTPACEETKKNISVTGHVAVENSVSKQSTPIIDHCTDKVRICNNLAPPFISLLTRLPPPYY